MSDRLIRRRFLKTAASVAACFLVHAVIVAGSLRAETNSFEDSKGTNESVPQRWWSKANHGTGETLYPTCQAVGEGVEQRTSERILSAYVGDAKIAGDATSLSGLDPSGDRIGTPAIAPSLNVHWLARPCVLKSRYYFQLGKNCHAFNGLSFFTL